TDRSCPGDDHVLAGHREGECSVGRVSQRVEHGGEVGVEVVGLHPDVAGRDDDIVGEGAGAVDPDALGVDAHVAPPGATVATGATHDVPLARGALTHRDAVDVLADLDHLAIELVADGQGRVHGRGRPVVPLLEVQVGATEAGPEDADLDVRGPG